MRKRMVQLLLVLAAMAVTTAPALAQRSRPGGAPAEAEKPEAEKPLTRADKARKLFSDATSLWQTKRGLEAAAMFESIRKNYPTSELIPEALAWAIRLYYGSDQKTADELIAFMIKNFPNNRYTVWAYWRPIEAKCNRDSKEPAEEQIRLLEIYLDRYWAQANFYEAIEMLARALMKAGQTKDLDAFLSHVLAETDPANMGGMINMIQRACGGRADSENMAAVYGNAAKDIDDREPAIMPIRLLEISYLIRAGTPDPRKKDKETDEEKQQRTKCLDEALKKAEAIIRERPKSEHAAYCALQVKPGILSRQEKPAEAAEALKQAMNTYGIFALRRHRENLADCLAAAGDFAASAAEMETLLKENNWPFKQKEYLDQRRDWLLKAGDVDGALKANDELVRLFPDSRASLGAELSSVVILIDAQRLDQAKAALQKVMDTYKGRAAAAPIIYPYIARFTGDEQAADVKAMREKFVALFPAAEISDEARKALSQPVEQSPVAQAKALFAEYQSFAKENNVDAARRRIDKLLSDFPSSEQGLKALQELGAALDKAGKPEMGAELFMLIARHFPLYSATEERLRDASSAYSGASRPDEALKARRILVDQFRYSTYWERYVQSAAGTLDAQGNLSETEQLVSQAAARVGPGVVATDIRAYMARRLEGQDQWSQAADKMLELLGSNASNPEYRPMIGEAFRFCAVAGGEYRKKEARLLEGLATRYEGWDEADRIRMTLAGSYARDGDGAKAVRLVQEIQKRHPKYEIGAHSAGQAAHLSKYSRHIYQGTVGYHVMDRVSADISGGWDNYLYAHNGEDMIDYVLSLRQPQAYVDRLKAELARLIKTKPNRPPGYKSGLPYRTKNIPRAQWHPWPEQRRVYHLVSRLDDAMNRLQPRQDIDAALWLEVYDLWPHYYMNDERVRGAACALIGRNDRAGTARALAILNKQYNRLVWEPYVLAAQANYSRYHGAGSQAMSIYKTIATKYPDHVLAAGAAAAYAELGGR